MLASFSLSSVDCCTWLSYKALIFCLVVEYSSSNGPRSILVKLFKLSSTSSLNLSSNSDDPVHFLYFFNSFLKAVRCVATNLASDLISSPALITSFSNLPYRSSRPTGIRLSAVVVVREDNARSCFLAWSACVQQINNVPYSS